jgi:hypothetical protein
MQFDEAIIHCVLTGTGGVFRATRVPVGEVVGVGIKCDGTVPGTTTMVLATAAQDGYPAQTILNLAANNSSQWYYPTAPAQDNTGANRLYAAGGSPVPIPFVVQNYLEFTVANCVNAAVIDVIVLIRR